MSKVTFNLDLSDYLDQISSISDQNKFKKAVGDYIVEQILEDVSQSKSPVTGRQFVKLSKEYKQYKKKISSSPVANMELFGDMLDSLKFKSTASEIEIGIFDKKQALKADNHNKFSTESLTTAVPRRPFIPNSDNGEQFRPAIRKEIDNIAKDFYDSSAD